MAHTKRASLPLRPLYRDKYATWLLTWLALLQHHSTMHGKLTTVQVVTSVLHLLSCTNITWNGGM